MTFWKEGYGDAVLTGKEFLRVFLGCFQVLLGSFWGHSLSVHEGCCWDIVRAFTMMF